MPSTLQLFGPVHLAILAAVPLLAAILAAVQRRLAPGSRGLRFGLALVLFVQGAAYYLNFAWHGERLFPNHMPLELCDVTLMLTILALCTLKPAIFDLAYYGALAGATMSLLTPNLSEPLLSFITVQYFVNHGLIVAAALYLVWSGQARPRPGSVARMMLWVNLYAVFAGAFDFFFKTDYMFLGAKPQAVTLLSFLGPWPWYILVCEPVGLVLFLLLYLPFRQAAALAPDPVAEPNE
ncbi:MAG: TIGR02206 family membrane protein [Terracidiphilus sp.]|nr:TIGR02206 family membrane protein [Terracidiphilus sp.]